MPNGVSIPRIAMPALLAGIFLFSAACGGQYPAVQRISHYPGALQKPLAQRVIPASAAIIARTHRTNLDFGMDVRPRPASPDHPLAPLVRDAISQLPPPVAVLAERHLVAIYLVQDDFGTAVTEGVQDEGGRWRHSYIALNLTALGRTANQWGSWKERSTFIPKEGYTLNMVLARQDQDDRTGAIRFILLHELGHAIGLGLGLHGYWEDEGIPPATRNSPFVGLSWEVRNGSKLVSRWKERFPLLHKAAFYTFEKAPLTLAEAESIYGALGETDFPSLYGSTNHFDDFAEAFAIYVHTRLLGRPYRVRVVKDGKMQRVFRSCIATGACPRKIALVEKILNSAGIVSGK